MNNRHILSIGIVLIFVMSTCGTASAWLPDYNHRMSISVSNPESFELTNYQFNFTNDTNTLVAAGHMQASGADCRITDHLDNPISSWNETAFNAAGTKIWANATLPVGDNMFYMYYGNAAASSVSSISNKFVFGDDFESYSISGDWYTKYANNPVIPLGTGWEANSVRSPKCIYVGGTYYLYHYGHEAGPDTYPRRVGVASSTDRYNFTKSPSNPILSQGASGAWDDAHVMGSPIYTGSEYWEVLPQKR